MIDGIIVTLFMVLKKIITFGEHILICMIVQSKHLGNLRYMFGNGIDLFGRVYGDVNNCTIKTFINKG